MYYVTMTSHAQWTIIVQKPMAEPKTTTQNHANFFSSSESGIVIVRTSHTV